MVIEVNEISKKFKNQEVLKNVSVKFSSGHIYGLIGRNGSGKTVLLKCISGLMDVDTGKIFVDKQELKKELELLPNAGIIIERPAFLENYNAFKNLDFLYTIRNKTNKQYLMEVLKSVGLDPISKKKVKNFSVGMKQRLGLAQAIMEEPSVLLLDEPLNGLDYEGTELMRNLFLKLKKENKLLIIASHYKEDIENLCDTVYKIEAGIVTKVY